MISLILGNWQRLALYAALAAVLAAGLWGHGYYKGLEQLWNWQAEQAVAVARVAARRAEINARDVVKYIKTAARSEIVERVVEKEVVRYVETNPGHCLDAEWRRLHDASTGAVPGAAGGTDAAGGTAPTAAAALETVTQNNARCIRTADRLDALQEWVRTQCEVLSAEC
jgi:hypothetical protein